MLTDGILLTFILVWNILQIHTLFLPTKIGFPIYGLILVAIFSILGIKSWYRALLLKLRTPNRTKIWAIVLYALFSVAVYWQATCQIDGTDSWLYHLNFLKWVRDYGVVSGLANLHSRLGYNSSFHIFATIFDLGRFENKAAHIALPFLAVLSIVRVGDFLSSSQLQNATNAQRLPILCCLAIALQLASSPTMSSLSTDHALAFICILIAIEFCTMPAYSGSRRTNIRIFILCNLSAIAVTTKLAAFPLPILIFLFTLVYCRMQCSKHEPIQKLFILGVQFLVLPCICLIVHCIASIKLSGWPFFPIPIGDLHLSFGVRSDLVVSEFESISNWAKYRSSAPPESFAIWFVPWIKSSLNNNFFLLNIISLGSILSIFRLMVKDKTSLSFRQKSWVYFALSGSTMFAFWITGAPDIRFMLGNFCLIAPSSILGFVQVKDKSIIAFSLLIIVAAIMLHSSWPNFKPFSEPQGIYYIANAPSMKVTEKIINKDDPDHSFSIFVPLNNNICGNSELPCTPYPSEQLRLRTMHEISDGFEMIKSN